MNYQTTNKQNANINNDTGFTIQHAIIRIKLNCNF